MVADTEYDPRHVLNSLNNGQREIVGLWIDWDSMLVSGEHPVISRLGECFRFREDGSTLRSFLSSIADPIAHIPP